ncbi:MAG: hypothetical protein GY786_16375 [Proteobacteria bacterium]|nr:hypothetical protein [Pseudomonadota bacterium]
MRLTQKLIVGLTCGFLVLSACSKKSKPKPQPRAIENFLTLADVSGRTSFKEDSPEIRVINIKAKSFIKRNNIRAAKQLALEIAANKAVDEMVRELLGADAYNNNYEKIDNYLSKNIDKYIDAREVNRERKIFLEKFYGISASFKVNRQSVLVALQKDLRLINTSSSTLITVVTSPKDLDLSSVGFKFSDIENSLMNQAQTDLNQRGLRAMDFRNAVVSMQTDKKKRNQFAKISKEQFMNMIAGTKASDALLQEQVANAEEFYSTGLSLLKQLAKVVIEINILSVNKTGSNMVMNVGVTAKNISVGTGGAFANSTFTVARRGGPNTDDSAMLTGLIKDTYASMAEEFIPQVIKEMSTIEAGSGKLIPYEIVLKGFDGRDSRTIRRAIEAAQDDKFRYIDFDNTLSKAKPPMSIVFVRFAGKSSQLGDKMMDIMDDRRIDVEEPIVAPGLTDLVFSKIAKKKQ